MAIDELWHNSRRQLIIHQKSLESGRVSRPSCAKEKYKYFAQTAMHELRKTHPLVDVTDIHVILCITNTVTSSGTVEPFYYLENKRYKNFKYNCKHVPRLFMFYNNSAYNTHSGTT